METNLPRIGQGLSTGIHDVTYGSKEFYKRAESIQYGVSLGLSLLDTAENYGNGVSEQLVGHAIRKIRSEVQIATKFSPENSDYRSVLRSAEHSLQRMNIDYIDLYQIHWPNFRVPIQETLAALYKLKADGKIKSIGVCNFSKNQLKKVEAIVGKGQIISNQIEFNLYDRFIETEILPYCISKHIKIIAYSPLDKGRVLPASDSRDILSTIATKYGITIEQLALIWVTSNPNIIAIPGTTSNTHLKENSQCLDINISDSDLHSISELRIEPVMVLPGEISVSEFGEENRMVYHSLDQAKENLLNLCPSPYDLSLEILEDPVIKPVRLVTSPKLKSSTRFELIEGRVRYWAWVIAFGYDKPIPAYIRDYKQVNREN